MWLLSFGRHYHRWLGVATALPYKRTAAEAAAAAAVQLRQPELRRGVPQHVTAAAAAENRCGCVIYTCRDADVWRLWQLWHCACVCSEGGERCRGRRQWRRLRSHGGQRASRSWVYGGAQELLAARCCGAGRARCYVALAIWHDGEVARRWRERRRRALMSKEGLNAARTTRGPPKANSHPRAEHGEGQKQASCEFFHSAMCEV